MPHTPHTPHTHHTRTLNTPRTQHKYTTHTLLVNVTQAVTNIRHTITTHTTHTPLPIVQFPHSPQHTLQHTMHTPTNAHTLWPQTPSVVPTQTQTLTHGLPKHTFSLSLSSSLPPSLSFSPLPSLSLLLHLFFSRSLLFSLLLPFLSLPLSPILSLFALPQTHIHAQHTSSGRSSQATTTLQETMQHTLLSLFLLPHLSFSRCIFSLTYT